MFVLPGVTAKPAIVFSSPIISKPETDILFSLIDTPYDSLEASMIDPGLPSIFIGILWREGSSAYRGCFPLISFLFVLN